MLLRQAGELKLLKQIREKFSVSSKTDGGIIVGIGDDAAVFAPGSGIIMITTDMMNEGVHFDLSYASPMQLGFKLVSVNVSDIMAMGGRPEYLFLNIAVKEDTLEEFFWDLYEGITQAAGIYGVKLLGGDLSSAIHDMVLSATVTGTGDRIVRRAGASVGDEIYITGSTGDSACGLEILKRLSPESRKDVKGSWVAGHGSYKDLTCDSGMNLEWTMVEPLLRRHLMPVARDSSCYVKHANSMIDISDGLFIDLCRICDESDVGARVYEDRIPLSAEMKQVAGILGLAPLSLAVSGGEDYELLFTAPPGSALLSGGKVICIGEITGKDRVFVDKSGRETVLKAEGYQHFGS